jgi:DNA-directed RNA polymerase specialized sigma24 family protein
VALRYAAGLTSEEIGAVVGLSGPGTRRRLQSALSKLRMELTDD